MNRRLWTGVVAGVLAAVVLLTVGVGAYRAGQEDEVDRVVTERAPDGSAEAVRVVGDHDWHGPGPGFFLIPLLVILLIVFLVRGRGWGGWHRPHGYGPWHGGGWPGGPGGPSQRAPWFDEWHREAHEQEPGAEVGASAETPSGTADERTRSPEDPPPGSPAPPAPPAPPTAS